MEGLFSLGGKVALVTGGAQGLGRMIAQGLVARFCAEGEDRLDILVNNAGRTWGTPVERFPDKAWPGVLAVNVQAPFRLVQEGLPLLEKAGTADTPARIINIGSVTGARPNDLDAYSYGASKAALHHPSRQLARDLVERHITVNALLPGFFPTGMTAHLRGGRTPTWRRE